MAGPARGQLGGNSSVHQVSLGGVSGLPWSSVSFLNVLTDDSTVPGVLQPLELRPDENFLPALFARYPFERRVDAADPLWLDGMPRLWRAFGVTSTREPVFVTGRYLVDGDHATFRAVTNYLDAWATSELFTIDVGGPLPLERFALQMPPPELTDKFGEPWENYIPINGELSASEHGAQLHDEFTVASAVTGEFGEFNTGSYQPLDQVLRRVEQNFTSPLDLAFRRRYFRYVRWMTFPDEPGTGKNPAMLKLGYGEFELFGNGFAGHSRFQTTALSLEGPAIIGRVDFGVSYWRRQGVRWREREGADSATKGRVWERGELVQVGSDPAHVDLALRIKTGATPDPRKFFGYRDTGELVEVDFATWEQLRVREIREHPKYIGWQGPVTIDREMWTPWSGQIRTSGTEPSLATGRFLQLRVEMTSDDPREMVRLDSVRIELFPPLVPTLVGEVGLADRYGKVEASQTFSQAPVGKPVDLVYSIRADFTGAEGAGFDAVRIQTPSVPEFLGLRMGDPPVDWDPQQVRADPEGFTLYLATPRSASGSTRVMPPTTSAPMGCCWRRWIPFQRPLAPSRFAPGSSPRMAMAATT